MQSPCQNHIRRQELRQQAVNPLISKRHTEYEKTREVWNKLWNVE